MGSSFYSGLLDSAKSAATDAAGSAAKSAVSKGSDYVTQKTGVNLQTVSPEAAKTFSQPANQTQGPSPDDANAEIFGKGYKVPAFSENKYLYMALGAVLIFAVVYYVKIKK